MIPLFAIAAPLIGAIAIAVSGDRPHWRALWTALAAVTAFGLVVALFPRVLDGEVPTVSIGELAPGVEVVLRVDAASMVFALSTAGLWLFASLYSFGYMNGAGEIRQTRFFAAFALCVSTTIGLAFAGNLFTFFVFYELLTLATYPLVIHKQTPAAFAAGRRYLFTLLGGGTALLLAVVIVAVQVPGSVFTPGGSLGSMSDAMVIALVGLALAGFGTKAAVMPLHGWLPRAMVAPTPVSALLHAVAVVTAGVFGFVRMFGYVIGPERLASVNAGVVVAALAAITIVAASLTALRQDQLKRRLAYSTIAHLSYIVLGVSLLSVAAWNGAMLHLINHAVLKITLFFAAGAIYVTTGVERVSQMDGIGRRMPLTMAAFGVASLGLAGLPPINGFVSKWFLSSGTVEAGQPILAIVMISSGLLTASYLLPIVYRAFFRSSPTFTGPLQIRTDAAWTMLVPIVATAAISLALGLGDLFDIGVLTEDVARSVIGDSASSTPSIDAIGSGP
jgi:multicomponent Na+:H+ antiporter subunit D